MIKRRFSDSTISALLVIKWWDWPQDRIMRNIDAIQSGQLDEIK